MMSTSLPPYEEQSGPSFYYKTIQQEAKRWSSELRAISLEIHDHPELAYHETLAHSLLTSFLTRQGFTVTPSFVLHTAFKAEFTYPPPPSASRFSSSEASSGFSGGDLRRCFGLSKKGRVSENVEGKSVGVEVGKDKGKGRMIVLQSEYDALPGLGHACGHNLIAISGILALLTLRHALITHHIPGTLVLLGTPAEEGGGGKIPLLKSGAYDGASAVLMCHPGPGRTEEERNWGSVRPSLAIQTLNVDFRGRSAHAAGAPWEGINALDAVMLAYSSISSLRQQLPPGDRVHGIVTNGGSQPNIIPELAGVKYFIRSPTLAGLEMLRGRVDNCFNAAALATSCSVEIRAAPAHFDQRNNFPLAHEYRRVMGEIYGQEVEIVGESGAGANGGSFSTDFGNVTYAAPSMGSSFAIPTFPHGGNHTPSFAISARSPEAHEETVHAAVGLACVGMRVLCDDGEFEREVRQAFESKRGW